MRSRCAFTARVIHSQLDLLSQPSAWYLSMASSHLCSLWSLKHLWILSHQYLLLGIPQCRWFLYAASQTLAGRPSCSWRDWSSFFTWPTGPPLLLAIDRAEHWFVASQLYSSPKNVKLSLILLAVAQTLACRNCQAVAEETDAFDHLSLLCPIRHSRYLWSTVSTTEFSRQRMPSCICWDWRSWSSLPLGP